MLQFDQLFTVVEFHDCGRLNIQVWRAKPKTQRKAGEPPSAPLTLINAVDCGTRSWEFCANIYSNFICFICCGFIIQVVQ